jgi:hypothetical protein
MKIDRNSSTQGFAAFTVPARAEYISTALAAPRREGVGRARLQCHRS